MIARDEEKLLPGCLSSVVGVVDEVIVVDTGSLDRTREIARAAGASLVEHPWADDFAAARNAALRAATGDWILVLDADERLAPGAAPALRAAMESRRADCFLLPLHNATHLDAAHADVLSGLARRGEPILLPRLLRRTPDLAWEGVVHEDVRGWLARGRRKVEPAGAAIIHYGAIPSLRAERGKDLRNLRLLEIRNERGEDPVARTYLARELIRTGQHTRADREIERAWTALRAAVARGENPARVDLASMRAHRMLERGEPEAVRAMIGELREWGTVVHPNLRLQLGLAAIRTAVADGRWGEAEAAFRAGLAGATVGGWAEELLPGATGWRAATLLASVLVATGRSEEALSWLDRADAEATVTVESALARAEAMISLDPARCLALVERLPEDGGADGWLLAAEACDALGNLPDRRVFLERAEAAPLRSPHRRPRMLAACARGRLGTTEPWGAAIRRAPQDPVAWLGLLRALAPGGEGVRTASTGAARLCARDVPVLHRAAELLLSGETRGDACRLARLILDLSPNHAGASQVLEHAGAWGGAPRRRHAAVRPGVAPLLSVFIVPFPGGSVELLLDHLALQDLPSGAFEVLLEADPAARPRPFPVVTGGIQRARGTWVLVYTSDVLPPPDALRRHLDAQRRGGEAVLVGGLTPVAGERDPLAAVLADTGVWPCAGVLGGDWGLVGSNTSAPRSALEQVEPADLVEPGRLARLLLRTGATVRWDPSLATPVARLPSLGALLATAASLGSHLRSGAEALDSEVADRLERSVAVALARGVPARAEDRARLQAAVRALANHHFARGASS